MGKVLGVLKGTFNVRFNFFCSSQAISHLKNTQFWTSSFHLCYPFLIRIKLVMKIWFFHTNVASLLSAHAIPFSFLPQNSDFTCSVNKSRLKHFNNKTYFLIFSCHVKHCGQCDKRNPEKLPGSQSPSMLHYWLEIGQPQGPHENEPYTKIRGRKDFRERVLTDSIATFFSDPELSTPNVLYLRKQYGCNLR